MKACQKCGILYSDENMFCENCGGRLTPWTQPMNMQNIPRTLEKKKGHTLFYLFLAGVVLIILVLLFLPWDKLPFGEKGTNALKLNWWEELFDGKEPDSSSLAEHSEESEAGSEKKEEAEELPIEQESYADIEMNGVDNVYIQVAGMVERGADNFVLELEKASSACAYDREDHVVQKKDITSLALTGNNLEEYLGDKVEIKGKLSVDDAGDFSLQVVKMDVRQEAFGEETDFAGHRYQLIQSDVTWQEAFDDCIDRGGYLTQINSYEEYRYIIDLIEGENMQNVHFYLGGRREIDSQAYYWVSADGHFAGETLNPEGQSWISDYWMENEPSFTAGDDMELYMNLIHYKENWVFNDVPLDITVYYPGKTGYICEFDE